MSIRLNPPVSKAPFNPTQYISLVLSNQVSSKQPFFVASYADYNPDFVAEYTKTGTSNNTTPIILVPTSGVNISRKLTFLSINNTDTVPATITISINTVTGSGTGSQTKAVTIFECTLSPNFTLVYNEEDNFRVFDRNGVNQEGNSSYYQQAESLGLNLIQRPVFNAFSGILMKDNPSWMRTDIYLADTGVVPGTYGGSGHYLTISVNSQGQITFISST